MRNILISDQIDLEIYVSIRDIMIDLLKIFISEVLSRQDHMNPPEFQVKAETWLSSIECAFECLFSAIKSTQIDKHEPLGCEYVLVCETSENFSILSQLIPI